MRLALRNKLHRIFQSIPGWESEVTKMYVLGMQNSQVPYWNLFSFPPLLLLFYFKLTLIIYWWTDIVVDLLDSWRLALRKKLHRISESIPGWENEVTKMYVVGMQNFQVPYWNLFFFPSPVFLFYFKVKLIVYWWTDIVLNDGPMTWLEKNPRKLLVMYCSDPPTMNFL